MKTIFLWAFAAVLFGCATVQKVAQPPPLGTWFERGSGKELFVLENDGSGSWKGTAYRKFYWSYDQEAKVVTITELGQSAERSRFSYSESDRLLRSIDDSKLVAVSEKVQLVISPLPGDEPRLTQSPQRNAGSRPSSGDSAGSETPSSLGPRR